MKTLQTRFHIAAQQNHITLQTGREPYVCICSCNSTKLAVNENMNSNTKPTCPHQALASRLDHRLLSDAVHAHLHTCTPPCAGTHARTRHAPREPDSQGLRARRAVSAPSTGVLHAGLHRCHAPPPLPYVSPLSPPIYGGLGPGPPHFTPPLASSSPQGSR